MNNGAMDQGVAAAFAGVIGLVGAGIGGLATAYGARLGAKKSLEAVGIQVKQQAEAEHRHWLRDQRTQACVSFIDAFLTCAASLNSCHELMKVEEEIPPDQLTALSNDVDTFRLLQQHLRLWGPPDLATSARLMASAAAKLRDIVNDWPDIQATGDSAAMRAHRQTFRDESREMGPLRSEFMNTAQRTFGQPA